MRLRWWRRRHDQRAADQAAGFLGAAWPPGGRPPGLRGGETVWLVFYGRRLEYCEAFTTRSLAIAFAQAFTGSIVECRPIIGEAS